MQRILIIIPARNEENTIAQVLVRLREVLPEADRIVVNDGSTDATGSIISKLGEKQIPLPCNLGYGLALQTGLRYAVMQEYDVVVCMDADGQHRPEDVPSLVAALTERNVDMLIGSRFCHPLAYDSTFGRRIGQKLFSYLTNVFTGYRIYDTTSGFKVFNLAACRVLAEGTFWDFHVEAIVRLSLAGYRVEEHPVTVNKRSYGVSMHSFASVFHYPLKTLLLTFVATADALLSRREK